ncbi:MAG: type II secretion system GspH family protein [Heliobacteriaceae bacterium]|jgi:prepilin-type N-terminal cleavage/methylation domain-containing protein|nr:type II secretion system GspH family protein [Heliobacteriaceae bacterium]
MNRRAFTLAEVLITLGIIGVVAALTLPNLIYNHTKSVVETRLKKVYSTMNQAVMLAEAEHGDKKDWYEEYPARPLDWYNTYLAKHINSVKVDEDSLGRITIYFADGSALVQSSGVLDIRDWLFYPGGNPKKCNYSGRCVFTFLFQPTDTGPLWVYNYDKGFEPYKYTWKGTEADLYDNSYAGCRTSGHMCSAVIQYNGWKIPDDYPYKVSY